MPSGLPWGNGVAAAVLQHFPITVVAASVGTAVATNYYNFSLPLESACGKAILEIAVPTKYSKETGVFCTNATKPINKKQAQEERPYIPTWPSLMEICIGNGQWTLPLAMTIGNPLGISILALILLAVILQNDLTPYRAPSHSGELHPGK
jgi:hypothetical protein